MLVELRDVEVYIEPDDILSKALREGDLSVSDAICICEEEAGAQEILKSIDDEDIQRYCENKGIELECDFEMIVKNLKILSNEQRASLFWFIIGINDEEIKKLVTVELIVPKMNELINIKQKSKVINPIWDSRNDYSFATEEDIEINIRAYSESSLHLWMYDNHKDEELVDSMYKNISDLQKRLNEELGAEVTLPKIEDLLKATRGE
ncbi:hypothetical protein GJV85_03505 [Sulfurimonas aquatica]|uniref:Uncharacterized protein n=1 Tax=Sulfurimonas aquatica TaxID=2672570 RepID=A0A975AZ28_9BACT|nr:hypothetical protein [Sulfurimonas aquatica]QSZ41216.1 hypothetical protein GJV85_03505 [Sulfurimonas aquatica]